MKVILISTVACILFVASASGQSTQYKNENMAFQYDAPPGWVINDKTLLEGTFYVTFQVINPAYTVPFSIKIELYHTGNVSESMNWAYGKVFDLMKFESGQSTISSSNRVVFDTIVYPMRYLGNEFNSPIGAYMVYSQVTGDYVNIFTVSTLTTDYEKNRLEYYKNYIGMQHILPVVTSGEKAERGRQQVLNKKSIVDAMGRKLGEKAALPKYTIPGNAP